MTPEDQKKLDAWLGPVYVPFRASEWCARTECTYVALLQRTFICLN